jgi:hypothetical protein
VQRVLDRILLSPDAFPEYDDEHRIALVQRFPYLIIYRTQPDRIAVIAFAAAARRPGYWHGRS